MQPEVQKLFQGPIEILERGPEAKLDAYVCYESWANELWEHLLPLPLVPYPALGGGAYHAHRDMEFFSNTVPSLEVSRTTFLAKPFTSRMVRLLKEINDFFQEDYNGLVVNRYNKFTDNIGPHVDDYKTLGITGVVTISLGATRTFRVQHKTDSDCKCDVIMQHGSVVHMCGKNFQREFLHSIINHDSAAELFRGKEIRISVTFRKSRVEAAPRLLRLTPDFNKKQKLEDQATEPTAED